MIKDWRCRNVVSLSSRPDQTFGQSQADPGICFGGGVLVVCVSETEAWIEVGIQNCSGVLSFLSRSTLVLYERRLYTAGHDYQHVTAIATIVQDVSIVMLDSPQKTCVGSLRAASCGGLSCRTLLGAVEIGATER